MTTTSNSLAARVAEYKYFTVNITTNEILAEIPFSDVSFERALKGAGSFSGTIAVAPETKDLQLYDNTMPGNTALYVVRNEVCVWGGIIWGRDYNVVSRSLQIEASEFTSYLQHRNIWKTYNYDLGARIYKTTADGLCQVNLQTRQVTFPETDSSGLPTQVYIGFIEVGFVQYSGFYDIEGSPDPTATDFYIDIPSLPARGTSYYGDVTVSARVDTYQYIRELIQETFQDFTNVGFANELIEPGITEGHQVSYRSITSEVATVQTIDNHGLVVGQRVELAGVNANLDGKWTVSEIPSSTTFKFATPGKANLAINVSALSTSSVPIRYREMKFIDAKAINRVSRTTNVAEITTINPHRFIVGDLVIVAVSGSKLSSFNASGAAKQIIAVPSPTTFTYSSTGANVVGTACTGTVNYSIPKKSLRISTAANHSFAIGDKVYVSGADDPSWGYPIYDGYHEISDIPAGSTTVFDFEPDYYIGETFKDEPASTWSIRNRSNSLLTCKLNLASKNHPFKIGDRVTVNIKGLSSGESARYNGTVTITSVKEAEIAYAPLAPINGRTIQIACSGTVTKIQTLTGSEGISVKTITEKQRIVASAGATSYITTSTVHNFEEGMNVIVNSNDATFNNSDEPVEITIVPSTTQFGYTNSGSAVAANTAATGSTWKISRGIGKIYYPTSAVALGTLRTITVANHGFVTGQWVNVDIVGRVLIFNNTYLPVQITVTDTNTFTYTVSGSATSTVTPSGTSTVTTAAYVSKPSLAYVNSYGEFPNNADLGGMSFSNMNYSQKSYINAPLRGSEMVTIGDHLDKYANNPNGFDYRIDCAIETVDGIGTFTRTFALVPRTPTSLEEYLVANPLSAGEYAPPSAFGADNLTFEYPGNVNDVSLQENAENSITRLFVVGDGAGSGSGSEGARFSGAAASDLLEKGWPLLDGVEKQEWPLVGYNKVNVDNWGNWDVEADLHKTALRLLAESRPPMGEYSIKINGSLDPAVGTFNPGDWCQIIINDDFIAERLNSYLEPRNDVILRKVESIKVSVPNSPAFPEDITLNLVPEWDVDKSG
jgi:ribosomal protein L31